MPWPDRRRGIDRARRHFSLIRSEPDPSSWRSLQEGVEASGEKDNPDKMRRLETLVPASC